MLPVDYFMILGLNHVQFENMSFSPGANAKSGRGQGLVGCFLILWFFFFCVLTYAHH
jgi:hypothetical protein